MQVSDTIQCITCGNEFSSNGRIRRTCGKHSQKHYDDPFDRLIRVARKNHQNPMYQVRSLQLFDDDIQISFHDWMWYGL